MCRTVIHQREPIPVHRAMPIHRVASIPTHRREIVIRNIMERYTWEQYFMASNDLINNKFCPDFDDINKSSYAPVNF